MGGCLASWLLRNYMKQYYKHIGKSLVYAENYIATANAVTF